jgi:hypothetical protein
VTLRQRYTALEAENKHLTGRLTEAEAAIKNLRARIPPPATPAKPEDEPGRRDDDRREKMAAAATQSGAAIDSDLLDTLLRSALLDRPISPNDIVPAQVYAKIIENAARNRPAGKRAANALRLLTDLTCITVPAEINDRKGLKPDLGITGFGFVHHSSPPASALFTLKERSAPALYAFRLAESALEWNGQSPYGRAGAFLVSSLVGDALLYGIAAGDQVKELRLINAKPFYERAVEREVGIRDDTSEMTLPVRISSKVAVSNDGLRYAFASEGVGAARVPPTLEVRSTSAARPMTPNKLDLSNCGNLFEKAWSLSGLTFDLEAKVLVVGVSHERSLLAFDLTKGPGTSPWKEITFAEPVRDWAHTFQGSGFAGVTANEVIVEDLADLMSEGSKQRWRLNYRPRSESEPFSCVAFSPSGSFLAVGDEGGGVAILEINRRTHTFDEVLRLGHEGAILKLGFSPEGQVLAVLVKPRYSPSGTRQGILRLWASVRWEKGPQTGDPPRPAAGRADAPKTPPGG